MTAQPKILLRLKLLANAMALIALIGCAPEQPRWQPAPPPTEAQRAATAAAIRRMNETARVMTETQSANRQYRQCVYGNMLDGLDDGLQWRAAQRRAIEACDIHYRFAQEANKTRCQVEKDRPCDARDTMQADQQSWAAGLDGADAARDRRLSRP